MMDGLELFGAEYLEGYRKRRWSSVAGVDFEFAM